MPTTLDATPKGTTSNAYCTVDEASGFLVDRRLNGTAWSTASADDQARSLMWATLLLDQAFSWYGYPRTLEQALRWPRSGVLTDDGLWVDYDTIPAVVKNATAELALALLTRDRTAEPKLLGQGMSKVSLGSQSISIIIDPKQVLDLIPRNIVSMLGTYGEVQAGVQTGGRAIELRRV